MTWAGCISAIDTNLTTAGLTLTPTVTAIRQGEPDAVNGPVFAYWYAGDRESITGGNTFGKVNLEERVIVRLYFPAAPRSDSVDSSLEVYVKSAKDAVKSALWGDVHLGENCIGLEVTETESGWASVGGALTRVIEFSLWIDLSESYSIAN